MGGAVSIAPLDGSGNSPEGAAPGSVARPLFSPCGGGGGLRRVLLPAAPSLSDAVRDTAPDGARESLDSDRDRTPELAGPEETSLDI
eukprot:5731350-Pyramimonas_sp.AAC.1